MSLTVECVTAGYDGKAVVSGISVALESGETICLLGANGSGKTTLFKTILGLLPPLAGRISVNGEDIARWPRTRLARTFGYVPQAHTPPFAFCVRDVVLMARVVYHGAFSPPGRQDQAVVDEALERMNLSMLAGERYTELSGGERQLVLIARALAQQAPILLLDEPTSNLDFGNQMRVLHRVRELASEGFSILLTTHVPDYAFLCASHVALLKRGSLLALGSPAETLTQPLLEQAYGTPLRIADAGEGMRVVVPRLN